MILDAILAGCATTLTALGAMALISITEAARTITRQLPQATAALSELAWGFVELDDDHEPDPDDDGEPTQKPGAHLNLVA